MTKKEYREWQELTAASETHWVLDEITWLNQHEALLYRGGQNGAYILAKADGTAEIGKYEGALPHIGEAMFHPLYSNKVGKNAKAALHIALNGLCKTHLETLIQLS